MFCPGCGLEEISTNQFCRACGTDLRQVRSALEKPDRITASAESARNEIGLAVAAKIRQFKSVKELAKVAEEVLPEIEEFLESPEERRMRRVRAGMIIASIGAGAGIVFAVIAALIDKGLAVVAGLGFITLFIGLGFIINGLLFTVPKKILSDKSGDADRQRELDAQPTNELLSQPELPTAFTSVTEHTTTHLEEKQPIPRG